MRPITRHPVHVPRVRGPFIPPQGLGTRIQPLAPEPEVLEFPALAGTSQGGSATTGALAVKWSLAGTSTGDSVTGIATSPSPQLFPSGSFFPGEESSRLSLKWSLASTTAGSGLTGRWQLPKTDLYPDASLYLGVLPAILELVQVTHPVSDVAAAGWVVAPLWSKLDEEVASDADLVTGVAT